MRIINNKILIKVIDKEESVGGLIIPDNAKTKHTRQKGIIIKLDEKIKDFNVGDEIFFDRYSGTELTVEIENTVDKFLMLEESNVFAIIIKED